MATVYLAEDLRHQRKVAVKVLRAELAAALGPERFLREITIAANLQHPHILPLHDSGAGRRLPLLRHALRRGRVAPPEAGRAKGSCPIADAVRILRDLADALAYAHQQGVVHRDIKPENVMLSERHALVTDFGVAKAVSDATGSPVAHDRRRGAGHAGLHGAGAGRRRSAHRSPRRHLRVRRGGVRAAHRPAAVHGRHAAGRARGARHHRRGSGDQVPRRAFRRRSRRW